MEPSYGVYFRDGSQVDLHTEREKMRGGWVGLHAHAGGRVQTSQLCMA